MNQAAAMSGIKFRRRLLHASLSLLMHLTVKTVEEGVAANYCQLRYVKVIVTVVLYLYDYVLS